MQDDAVAAAVDDGLRLCGCVELVRHQPSGSVRPYRVHRKIGNDVLRGESRPFDGGFDRSLHALWKRDGNVANTGLKVDVKIAIGILRRHSDNDISETR